MQSHEEGGELVRHELRHVGAGTGFGLRNEGRGVLLHQAVQRGLLSVLDCPSRPLRHKKVRLNDLSPPAA